MTINITIYGIAIGFKRFSHGVSMIMNIDLYGITSDNMFSIGYILFIVHLHILCLMYKIIIMESLLKNSLDLGKRVPTELQINTFFTRVRQWDPY